MDTHNVSDAPFTVVVATGFTDAGGHAFDQAARIAWRIPGSRLHVVDVEPAETTPERATEVLDHARLYLEEKLAALGAEPAQSVPFVMMHVRRGPAQQEIARFATDVGADLLIIGTHPGLHLKEIFFGSSLDFLVRSTPCPVLVASPIPAAQPSTDEPVIEPPCADCLAVRRASGGAALWCARHDHRARLAHRYGYQTELSFGSRDDTAFSLGPDL